MEKLPCVPDVGECAPLGAEMVMVRAQGGGQAWEVPSYAFDFLMSWDEMRPLDEQLRSYAKNRQITRLEVEGLVELASAWREQGLLLSAEDLRSVPCEPGLGEIKIESLGIPTSGNVERLRRAIKSHVNNSRNHGTLHPIYVAASQSPENLKNAIGELEREEQAQIFTYDKEKVNHVIQSLVQRSGVPEKVVNFSLSDPFQTGFSCGANRNFLFMRNAGKAYASIDDDVVVAPRQPASLREGFALYASRDAFRRDFHPDINAACKSLVESSESMFSAHEKILGFSQQHLLHEHRLCGVLGNPGRFLARWKRGKGRVVATFCGHAGDPGIPTSVYFLSLTGKNLERLTASESIYEEAMLHGVQSAVAQSLLVGDATMTPGMAFAQDARTILPPFFPVLHAEDYSWGAALWHCLPDALVGQLPFAVRHDPGGERRLKNPQSLLAGPPVGVFEFAHLLRSVIFSAAPPVGVWDPERRMEALGRYLVEIGSSSERDYLDFIHPKIVAMKSAELSWLEHLRLDQAPECDGWHRDVESYLQMTQQALALPDFDVPMDMWKFGKAATVRPMIQGLLRSYGELLIAWPSLFEAARTEDWARYEHFAARR